MPVDSSPNPLLESLAGYPEWLVAACVTVVAVVAQVLEDRLVAAVRLVPLPQEPEVAALASLLAQGLVASEARLRSR